MPLILFTFVIVIKLPVSYSISLHPALLVARPSRLSSGESPGKMTENSSLDSCPPVDYQLHSLSTQHDQAINSPKQETKQQLQMFCDFSHLHVSIKLMIGQNETNR